MNMINSAIHLLSKKTHSERELCDVLEAQYSALPNLDTAIHETLTYLRRHKLVHDARLAQDIALRYAHKGNQFIQNASKQRKISSEQINAALMTIPDERTRAFEEAQKKLNHDLLQNCSKQEQINTLARFLSGRQFNYSIINDIIHQLNSKELSHVRTQGGTVTISSIINLSRNNALGPNTTRIDVIVKKRTQYNPRAYDYIFF